MLKSLIQNPALYAQGSIKDAAREMRPATEVENTPAEKLDAIRHAEGSLSAARRYLDMAKAKARHRKRAATGRIIHRDVATRYLKRYGGYTQKVPTPYAHDAYFVYLFDHEGEKRGEVSMFDKFPKPQVFDLPY